MKNIIIILCLLFSSCNDAMDENKCFESVKKVFPTSKIYQFKSNEYIFIVIDTISVKKVKTQNFTDSDISSIEFLTEKK